jgi:SAM-dependent methyltransferase
MTALAPPTRPDGSDASDGSGDPLVVDGIPWNRPDRDELRDDVRRALRRGDQTRALLLLLGDADNWWDEPAPPEADLRRALEATTLREAASWLGLGRVGDYFAHRWSDPTYLAGLGLLAQAWPTRPGRVVEIACGVGHYLRELELRGAGDLVGIDVVFSKLWLARRFVCPSARYLCLDATARLPFADAAAELVLCQDAIYFLPEQEQVLAEMQRVGRTVAVGHAHLPGQPGRPRSAEEWAALLPGATVYDDDELTRAVLEARDPEPGPPYAEAVNLLRRRQDVVPVTAPDLGAPLPGRSLRVNPLYRHGQREWPNDRYAAEYGPRATYLPDVLTDADLADETMAYRRRLLLDLPERW